VSSQSSIKGTYVFKENGKEIGRSQNLITQNGRKVFLQYLAGVKTEWASNLAIGALPVDPGYLDTQLNFETGRFPVTLKTYQAATTNTPDLIIVRATLPPLMYANIYEVGIYPQNALSAVASKNNKLLVDFSDLSNWVTYAGSTSITGFTPGLDSSPRIGNYSVELAPGTTYSNNTFSFEISNYSSIDTLQILAYNTVAGNLTMTLTDRDGYSTIFNYTLQNNAGWQVLQAPIPTTITNPSGTVLNTDPQALGTINTVTFTTDSTATVTLDVVKGSASAELSNNDYIISKSVLQTPIAKTYGVALDIEYFLELL